MYDINFPSGAVNTGFFGPQLVDIVTGLCEENILKIIDDSPFGSGDE